MHHLSALRGLLRRHPIVCLIGARQVGKTTLARQLAAGWRGPCATFDLEDPEDLPALAIRSWPSSRSKAW